MSLDLASDAHCSGHGPGLVQDAPFQETLAAHGLPERSDVQTKARGWRRTDSVLLLMHAP